ncbi:unnamed protein product [Cochlearia groenlandica]
MSLINNFHDDILLRILSFAPTKTVFDAKLVCKRWRYLWRSLTRLNYDYTLHDSELSFLEFMRMTLQQLETPVLQSLYIIASLTRATRGVVIKTNLLTRFSLRELWFININPSYYILLGKALYEFHTLVSLRLQCSKLEDSYGVVYLPSLTVLELRHVKYPRDETLSDLLPMLPNLKDLVLYQCLSVGHTTTLTINLPRLKKLKVIQCPDYCRNHFMVLNVQTRSLKYLNIGDYWRKVCFSDEKMQNLIEAEVDVTYIDSCKFLRACACANRLGFCLITTKIPLRMDHAIFYRLIHLEICTCQKEWWYLLARILLSSPILRFLKLLRKHPHETKGFDFRWIEPRCVPTCFAFHFETFEWRDYEGTEQEIGLACYVLRNALRLKFATFYPLISHTNVILRRMVIDYMRKELLNACGCCFTCTLLFI